MAGNVDYNQVQKGCQSCNTSYDVLTIIISMADVATDIVVLVDFYNKERTAFFGISLAILIMAQCSYSIGCAARYCHVQRVHFVYFQ